MSETQFKITRSYLRLRYGIVMALVALIAIACGVFSYFVGEKHIQLASDFEKVTSLGIHATDALMRLKSLDVLPDNARSSQLIEARKALSKFSDVYEDLRSVAADRNNVHLDVLSDTKPGSGKVFHDTIRQANRLIALIENGPDRKFDYDLFAQLTASGFERTLLDLTSDVANEHHRLGRLSTYGAAIGSMSLLFIVAVALLVIFFPMEKSVIASNQRLLLAKDRTKRADQNRNELIANLSHEIRTPMNGILGMSELLMRTDLDGKQKGLADVIINSGNSLLKIVNDILDFCKMDANMLQLDPIEFNLIEAIEDVADCVATKVKEKDLQFAIRVDPSLPIRFVGDASRIRQIIANLLGNAVKHTETGHIHLSVSGYTSKKGHIANLRFAIDDSGIGITEERCEQIREILSSSGEGVGSKLDSGGLMLVITASLVRLMGGEIGVETKKGKGCTFWFELALPFCAEAESNIPIAITGARVLVVDDNEINRTILLENLQAWNFDCAGAASGIEALSVMRTARNSGVSIDCLILDYKMPVFNGGDVVRMMQADGVLANIPVIMLSSVEQTNEGYNFSSLGIAGHLVKPVRSSVLLEMITDVLQDALYRNKETHRGIAMARAIGDNIIDLPVASSDREKFIERLRA